MSAAPETSVAREPSRHASRPSPWWGIVAGSCGIAALALVTLALANQKAADRPVGEGELFAQEAATAADDLTGVYTDPSNAAEAVRHVRNSLRIESVALVDPEGTIVAATSTNSVGAEVANPVIAFGHFGRRLTAIATSTATPVTIDGVVEWPVGSTLYEVLYPLGDGASAVLSYDISELLGRRSRASGIAAITLLLVSVAAGLAIIAALVLLGRQRALGRVREMERKAELLRTHSAELERHNRELDEAKHAAEDALALAEEKNRIRAEFVLMINHELRTPLTAVITGAQMLQETYLSVADRGQILTDLLHDGVRLEQMISQILGVARIENRGLNSALRDVPISRVQEQLRSALPATVPVTLESELLKTTSIRTDGQTLSQLIVSLTENATTHGASKVRVAIGSVIPFDPMASVGTPPSSGIFFSVIDNGPGIELSFLPRAFEKFEKDSFSSGTGLGLYVVRLMAEAIGSSISVTTTNSGTVMSVGVPRPSADHDSEEAA